MKGKSLHIVLLIAWISLSLIGLTFITTTFDNGDSISHYLHARHSWHHTDLLLNHWAKPFFTLITSPFAHFGLIGMKVFNIFCCGFAAFFISELLRLSNLKLTWLVFSLLFFANDYFLIQYSGLTEPFFAFTLTWGILFIAKNKWKIAAIILSILPFIRTEGLLLLPFFGIYYLKFNKIKPALFLALGFIVYSIIGKIYLGDFFWFFNENPYDSKAIQYGHGTWTYFLDQFPFVTGITFALLTALSLFWILSSYKKATPILLLLLSIFLTYFIFHSYAWALGKFNSFGMTRVLIGVLPLASFFIIWFLNRLILKTNLNPTIVGSFVFMMSLGLAFAHNPVSLSFQDLKLNPNQKMVDSAAAKYMSKINTAPVIYYGDQYFLMKSNLDPWGGFAKKMHGLKTDSIAKGTLVFWDSYYSPRDYSVNRDFFTVHQEFNLIDSFKSKDYQILIFIKQKE